MPDGVAFTDSALGLIHDKRRERVMTTQLPNEFKELEPFCDWALKQRDARYKKRIHSSMEVIRSFYDAVRPRIEEIVSYLNARPLDALNEEENRLLWLGLAWMDASRSVEVLGTPDVRYGLPAERFEVRDVAAV